MYTGPAVTAVATLLAAVTFTGHAGSSNAHQATTAASTTRTVAHVAAKRPGCHTPAPTTAAGYARMFADVDPTQWGAADVSISVAIPGGRSVWLYGDTFSTGRFVHSTAIVQHGGCLHVSHGGAQLLRNDSASHIYWIDAARWAYGHLLVRARSTYINPAAGVWGFHDRGMFRWFTATVSPAGDVTVTSRGPMHRAPLHGSNDFRTVGPHHFTYARHVHRDARLASGRTLVTVCQNWDDGVLHRFADYRPIFSSKEG
jgi:hypothetical protein